MNRTDPQPLILPFPIGLPTSFLALDALCFACALLVVVALPTASSFAQALTNPSAAGRRATWTRRLHPAGEQVKLPIGHEWHERGGGALENGLFPLHQVQYVDAPSVLQRDPLFRRDDRQ